jgi:uncharacterized membrane protein YfcA
MLDLPALLDDPWLVPKLAGVAVTILLAGFMRGFVGFGGALVAVCSLSLLVGPREAVALSALTGVPSTLQLLPTAVRSSEPAFVLPVGIAVFLAAPFGAWVLVTLDPRVMKIVIALLVLAMVGVLARGWQLARLPGTAALLGAGVASGLVQGCAGVGGPPAVALALARGGEAALQRANVVGALTAISLSSLAPLWYHGLFTAEVLMAGAALVPLYSGGTWLGARYFAGQGARHFRRASILGLLVVAIVTLALSVRDYAAS